MCIDMLQVESGFVRLYVLVFVACQWSDDLVTHIIQRSVSSQKQVEVGSLEQVYLRQFVEGLRNANLVPRATKRSLS